MNPQLDPQEEMDALRILELNENGSPIDDQSSDLNVKLLHHLVEIPRAVRKQGGEREAEELVKQNAELMKELLAQCSKPAASEGAAEKAPIVWKELLMQKLGGNLNLADEKVKKFVEKIVEAASKQINDLVDELVFAASTFGLSEAKVEFEFQPNVYSSPVVKTVNLRSLSFDLKLSSKRVNFTVCCQKMPVGAFCRVIIDAKIEDETGQACWRRTFSIVFRRSKTSAVPNSKIYDLLKREEYEDESLGLMKDGKVRIECGIRVAEYSEEPADKQ